MDKKLEWQAFEYDYQAKSTDWFWIIWILAIGTAITAYLFNNLLFGIFILISAFSLSLYASRKPDLLNFILSDKGISIGKKLISFTSLKSFWIEDDNPNGQRKIIFQANKKTVPYIVIPLSESVDTEFLREFLLKQLEEVEHTEPLSQKILEKLGF